MLLLKSLKVKNLRSLSELELPLKELGILIGKNNSGKSNILLAIKLLLEATKRDVSVLDFHEWEHGKSNEIEIVGNFTVPEKYLRLCNERHREKIATGIVDGVLTIRRIIKKDDADNITVGKIEMLDHESNEFGTPTGIDAAFKQILPEVIFIEAFKDPSEESKAKGTATLGKIIKHIVEQVSVDLNEEVEKALLQAERKFNVFDKGDGTFEDDRPKDLIRVEGVLRSHVREVFSNSDVRLKFNLPTVSDFLGTATVELKDNGPWTEPSGKGQGFQRILYVALLETLAIELRDAEADVNRPFILLYEEPEVFLHPSLQREAGNIIESISQTNQVIAASHSPLMVSPARMDNITIVRQETKLEKCETKISQPDESLYGKGEDRQFMSLLKLNNSSEFLFSDCVLVVEGISDKLFLDSCWSIISQNGENAYPSLSIIESGGKDTLRTWNKYLRMMGFPTRGVVDLDFLWRGAGNILENNPSLSQFMEMFWLKASELELRDVDDDGNEKNSIQKGKKKEAFSLFSGEDGDPDLRELSKNIRKDLRENNIWVLSQGEIEAYFGNISKSQYVVESQKIRTGEVDVPEELENILQWAIE